VDNPKVYLSTTDGKWTVISGGSPLCAPTTLARARAVAKQYRLPESLPIWDGDAGKFMTCGHCGEYWPCSDSQRNDIRPMLRVMHSPVLTANQVKPW
jgi:hypothetical protein